RPSPAISYPSFGSIVSHEFGPKNNLPPYICIPSQPNVFAGSGYLSSAYGPFSLGNDPANKGFSVRDLQLPGGIDVSRFTQRRSMLEAVNDHFKAKEKSDNLDAMDTFYKRAYSLISSDQAKEAFNISAEKEEIRTEYGQNSAGQRMLLARRLVAAGVRFVSLTYGGWDMHGGIKAAMANQAPDSTASEPEDDALSVEDLSMTVYNQLGIDGEKRLVAPGNRPIDIVRDGKVVKEIIA
ncbi:DUF1501 domain-containing protein, partial [bacterium]|nr:DUF1501 domain-containing protein [bacterium]